MRCESCNVVIKPEFTYAIKNNQCPACGQGIMQQAKLASYLSLRSLLESNVKDIDAETVASLIVANFELKQLFKEELQNHSEEGIIEVDEDEEEEEEVEEEDPDEEFKKQQKKDSKVILAKMRDEALGGALKDRYNIEDNGIVLEPDGTGMHEFVNKEKQMQSADTVASGLGGENSFSRSNYD